MRRGGKIKEICEVTQGDVRPLRMPSCYNLARSRVQRKLLAYLAGPLVQMRASQAHELKAELPGCSSCAWALCQKFYFLRLKNKFAQEDWWRKKLCSTAKTNHYCSQPVNSQTCSFTPQVSGIPDLDVTSCGTDREVQIHPHAARKMSSAGPFYILPYPIHSFSEFLWSFDFAQLVVENWWPLRASGTGGAARAPSTPHHSHGNRGGRSWPSMFKSQGCQKWSRIMHQGSSTRFLQTAIWIPIVSTCAGMLLTARQGSSSLA